MSSLAKMLNSCDAQQLGNLVSDLIRLNLQVQFDAEEYSRLNQYQVRVDLNQLITPELQRF